MKPAPVVWQPPRISSLRDAGFLEHPLSLGAPVSDLYVTFERGCEGCWGHPGVCLPPSSSPLSCVHPPQPLRGPVSKPRRESDVSRAPSCLLTGPPGRPPSALHPGRSAHTYTVSCVSHCCAQSPAGMRIRPCGPDLPELSPPTLLLAPSCLAPSRPHLHATLGRCSAH